MTREEAKVLLPFIKAFVEGKTIEVISKDSVGNVFHTEVSEPAFTPNNHYRIKPEPKYRPFKSQEECWNEMHKHPDFGWVRSKQWGSYALIGNIGRVIIRSTDECHKDSMNYIYENYTFTDGTPFGVKEE